MSTIRRTLAILAAISALVAISAIPVASMWETGDAGGNGSIGAQAELDVDVTVDYGCDGWATFTAAASGGDGSYTYLWDDGSTDATTTVYGYGTSGTVHVTVTDGSEATGDGELAYSINDSVQVYIEVSYACGGSATFTAYPYGGDGNYSYRWEDGSTESTHTISGFGTSGSASVTVTDGAGCTGGDSLPYSIKSEPKVTITVEYDCDGYATFTAKPSGGDGDFSLEWSDGSNGGTLMLYNPGGSGTVSVVATDGDGCTAYEEQPYSINTSLDVYVTVATTCDGTAILTAHPSGGDGAYSYLWNDGSTDVTRTVSGYGTSGSASVTVTDGAGCTATNGESYDINPQVQVSVSVDYECDGSATFIAYPSGGDDSSDYSYQWSNGSKRDSTNVYGYGSSGAITVTVTDAAGCTAIRSQAYSIRAQLGVTISVVNACDGSATLTAHPWGGDGSYSYLWGDGSTGPTTRVRGYDVSDVAYVTVTDGSGCTAEGEQAYHINDTVAVYIDPTTGCDGSATFRANPSGGDGSYAYRWEDGSTGAVHTITGFGISGTASVTVTDGAGCAASDSVAYAIEQQLLVTITVVVDCDGYATFTAQSSGGDGSYSFEWSDGSTDDTLIVYIGNGSGSVSVTVTDGDECTATAGRTYSAYTPLDVTISVAYACDGTATFTAHPSGGDGAYTYLWDDGATGLTTTVSGYGASGVASVILTDGAGCTADNDLDYAIGEAPEVDVEVAYTCDGSATFTAEPSGGDGSFSYLWNDGSTGATRVVTGFGASGTAAVTVTDGAGCTAFDSLDYSIAEQLDVTITVSYGCDGRVTFTAHPSGGDGSYGYLWDDGTTTMTRTLSGIILPHSVSVTVTDGAGCTATDHLTPSPGAILGVYIGVAYGCDGSVTLSAHASGGDGSYAYQWDNGSTAITRTITGYGISGTASVTVSIGPGCSASASLSFAIGAQLDVYVTAATACDGSATFTAHPSGGIGSYRYLWDDGSTAITRTLSGYGTSGTVSVTVTDAAGCTASDQLPYSIHAQVAVTIAAVYDPCAGQVTLTANPTGGVGSYSFQWDDLSTLSTRTLSGYGATGAVSVTVTDVAGCTAWSRESYRISDALAVAVVRSVDDCAGTVVFTATATGGNGAYGYAWDTDGDMDYADGSGATLVLTGMFGCAGSVTVRATDGEGCVATGSAAYSVLPQLQLSIVTAYDPAHGAAAFVAIAAGGTGMYSYRWADGTTGPAHTVTGVGRHGTVTATVTCWNGCRAVASAEYRIPSPLGFQFRDDNRDSIRQSGEPLLGRWVVYLQHSVTRATVDVRTVGDTDSPHFGWWFPPQDLPAGEYWVYEAPGLEWEQTAPTTGSGKYKIQYNGDGTYALRSPAQPGLTGLSFGNAPRSTAPSPCDCPDWIVFNSNRDGNWELYRTGPYGGVPVRLTDDSSVDMAPTRTSGALETIAIAFQSNRGGKWDIYRVDANGQNLKQLTAQGANTDPVWSPLCGAQALAFVSDRDGNPEIYVADGDGVDQLRLTNDPASDTDPDWAPTGDKLVFQSNRNGNWDIYQIGVDGLGLARMTTDGADDVDPSWSPDGRWISFRSNRSGRWQIYIMPASGGAAVQLSGGDGDNSGAAWSPDSSRLAYQSHRDGNWQAYTVRIADRQETRVTHDLANVKAPSWSCDSGSLVVQSDASGHWNLYRVDATTGALTARVTESTKADLYPMWNPQEEDGSLEGLSVGPGVRRYRYVIPLTSR